MYGFVFKSKLGALAFVGMTLYGVATLVGSEEDDGLIQQGVDTFQSGRESFADQVEDLNDPKPSGISGNSEAIASPFEQQSEEATFDDFDDDPSEFFEPQDSFDPDESLSFSDPSQDEDFEEESGEIIGLVVDQDDNRVMTNADDDW